MLQYVGQNGGDRAPRVEQVTSPMRQEVGGNEGNRALRGEIESFAMQQMETRGVNAQSGSQE